ncbi:Speckle targeted PIP5K1A-regulated poly(A) polymerase [Dirofilaria immitis]
MRSETKVSTARKVLLPFLTLRNLFRTIPMAPIKSKSDRAKAKHRKNHNSQRTKKRPSFRDRWMRKYYSLTLLEWLTKPLSPLSLDDSEDEPNSTSPPLTPSSQNLKMENGSGSTLLTEALNDPEFVIPSNPFAETRSPQAELYNSSSLLPTEESNDRLASHHFSTLIQRVRQPQLCIDPKDFVIPYTPITIQERLAGTDEIRIAVINTCGMTSLPYTLHYDDPFDTKYPNLTTLLPPISTFFNLRRRRQS